MADFFFRSIHIMYVDGNNLKWPKNFTQRFALTLTSDKET